MLSDQQLLHYQTFGFVVMRQLFTADELTTINAEFNQAMEAAYQHMPFDGSTRHWVTMLGPRTPFFANLLEDPRLCTVAEQLYGDDTLGLMADANRYVGDTNWHPDTHSFQQFGVKFAFYLEPVSPETGALRLIPGSHRQPLHDELRESLKALQLEIRDVPAFVCTSKPGDVVAFDLRTWHGSHGGSDDRRMCTCVYYNNPKTAEEEAATRAQAAKNSATTARYHRPDDPQFDPHWVANPERHPKRQLWIDRLAELGFFEAV